MVLQVRLKKPRTRPLRKAVKRSPKEGGAKVVEYEEQPPTRAGQNDTVQAQNTAFQNEGTDLDSTPKSRKSGALVLLMFCFLFCGCGGFFIHRFAITDTRNTMSAF
jgi:hypothetical protein